MKHMTWADEAEYERSVLEQAILLRVEDAARRLGIARTLMFRLIKDGEVESIRVGRLRRVPVESLEEYVDRLRQAQKSSAA
jgi:excisionase family DNA binding protein